MTVILGCGNALCSDDAVGLEAVRRLAGLSGVDVVEAGCPGFGLLDMMEGYRQAVIVDAVVSGAPPGTIHRFTADALPPRGLLPLSLHGANLVDALEMGRVLGRLPARVEVVGIEIADRTPYREGLSPEVAAALPELVKAVRQAAENPG